MCVGLHLLLPSSSSPPLPSRPVGSGPEAYRELWMQLGTDPNRDQKVECQIECEIECRHICQNISWILLGITCFLMTTDFFIHVPWHFLAISGHFRCITCQGSCAEPSRFRGLEVLVVFAVAVHCDLPGGRWLDDGLPKIAR